MLATARAFLEHLIDYAGMFPPARLPLRDALRNYAQLAATPDSWMLGRFVCPAPQLDELLALIRDENAPPLLAVAALGRGGHDADEFATQLDADLRDIMSFRATIGSGGSVDVVEMPLPSPLPCDAIERLVDRVVPRIVAAELRAFFEVPYGSDWPQKVVALSEALAHHNNPGSAEAARFGLKIRCGGAMPSAVPSIADLAFFVARCRDRRLPWKATAGLHHALCHENAETKTLAHGFLNVFAAGILAYTHTVDAELIAEILQERNFTAFRCTPDHFAWRDSECSLDDLRMARSLCQSFGSCSFDEPRDDLCALGLII
jgi:hypothetical protein